MSRFRTREIKQLMFETEIGIKTDEILPLSLAWLSHKSWIAAVWDAVANGHGPLMLDTEIVAWLEANLLQIHETFDHTEPPDLPLIFTEAFDYNSPSTWTLQFLEPFDS